MAYFCWGLRTKKVLTIALITLTILLTVALPQNSASAASWELQISNLSGDKKTLTYEQLTTMPNTTVPADLYCYSALVTSGQWTGIKVSDLLNQTTIDPSAISVEFNAQDGYKVTIPIETATQPNVILAYAKDSTPLTETLRLVIPQANGNFWIAMVTSINLSGNVAGTSFNPANGPAMNIPQQHIAWNTNPAAQSTQPTPTSNPTPNSPTLTPKETIPPTPTTTIPPTSADASPDRPQLADSVLQINGAYLVVIAVGVGLTLIMAGLIVLRHKNSHK